MAKCKHCGHTIYYSFGIKRYLHEGNRPSLVPGAVLARLKDSAFGQSAYDKWEKCEDEDGKILEGCAATPKEV